VWAPFDFFSSFSSTDSLIGTFSLVGSGSFLMSFGSFIGSFSGDASPFSKASNCAADFSPSSPIFLSTLKI